MDTAFLIDSSNPRNTGNPQVGPIAMHSWYPISIATFATCQPVYNIR